MTRTTAIGVMLPRDLPAERVREFARRADERGFDELWVVEDLGFRGGIAQAAVALAATERIRIGIGILPAAVRNVAFAAMELATLAQLFPGRLYAGIGYGMPGWMRSVGSWPEKPLRFLDEYVSALRLLLRGERVIGLGGLGGEGAQLDPSAVPEQPPPLLLGVRRPRSLALSGRVADGTVLAEPCAPEYVRQARERIGTREDHRVVAFNVGAVDDDAGRALAAARPALEWIGEPDWAPHLEPLPFAEELAALRAECADRREFVDRLPDEWIAALSLSGTPERVRARIAELGAAGLDSSVFIPAGDDPVAALDALGRVL
jgi:alkanesulfonate monooxygenase SsuD/methylene tetrahydromethanopterin reductase-like flavin-dependent oxidoreductase (luciferase family)